MISQVRCFELDNNSVLSRGQKITLSLRNKQVCHTILKYIRRNSVTVLIVSQSEILTPKEHTAIYFHRDQSVSGNRCTDGRLFTKDVRGSLRGSEFLALP